MAITIEDIVKVENDAYNGDLKAYQESRQKNKLMVELRAMEGKVAVRQAELDKIASDGVAEISAMLADIAALKKVIDSL